MNFEQGAVWGQHAKQWELVGPPLKPSPSDQVLAMTGLQPALKEGRCLVAILGVTPELVQLPWPASVELRAYDHSAPMIAAVWSPHPEVLSSVKQASWQHLPVEDATFDAVVGDGSLNALPNLGYYDEVFQELHRVLSPGGRAVIRCFIRPNVAETLFEVVAAVNAGLVGSFHALKWRIAMSLVDERGAGVAVSDIHKAFQDCFSSRSELAKATGWPPAVIDTIDAYKGTPTQYSFPTLAQLREKCPPHFELEALAYGSYELADRCPTLTWIRQEVGSQRHVPRGE